MRLTGDSNPRPLMWDYMFCSYSRIHDLVFNKENVVRSFYENFEWLILFLGGGEDSGLDSAE